MKTVILIAFLANFGFLIAQGADYVTSVSNASPLLGKNMVNIQLKADAAEGDMMIFSKAAAKEGIDMTKDPNLVLTGMKSALAETKEVTFKAGGAYNIYIKKGTNSVKQTATFTLTIPAPAADLVSSISPTTGAKATELTVTFTLKDNASLKQYQRLVFSTATTPTATDLAVEIEADATTTSTTGKFTFPADGNYTLFVDNGTPMKQGKIMIQISSSFITMSLGVLISMLLF